MTSFSLNKYVKSIVGVLPDVEAICLIGSRANGSAGDDSDWDLIVVANENGLAQIQAHSSLNRDDVDLLVVIDGNQFVEPWPENPNEPKSGSFSDWNWDTVGPKCATYTQHKFYPSEDDEPWFKGTGTSETKTVKGIRVWPE